MPKLILPMSMKTVAQIVEREAKSGANVKSIAASLGISKSFFLRIKSQEKNVEAAYLRGVEKFASSRGKVVEKIGGRLLIVNAGERPIRRPDSFREFDHEDMTSLVLRHLRANPAENLFRDIKRGTLLSSDEISDCMATLILERGLVKPLRGLDGDFRYFAIVEGRPTGISDVVPFFGFNQHQPAGVSHEETRRKATC